MWLLPIAIVGLIVGDGLFIYWLLNDYQGIGAALNDRLALSFIIDALLTLGILTVYFARNHRAECAGRGLSCSHWLAGCVSVSRSTGGSTSGRR